MDEDKSPKGFEPIGRWEWEVSSGRWQFLVGEEVVLELSDKALAEFQGRVPQEEDFIEFIEGTFVNSIVIRRIYKDPPDALIEFLKERGVHCRKAKN